MTMPSLWWPLGPGGLFQIPGVWLQRRAWWMLLLGVPVRGDTIQVTVRVPLPGVTLILNGSSLWSVGPLVSVTVIVIELIVMLL